MELQHKFDFEHHNHHESSLLFSTMVEQMWVTVFQHKVFPETITTSSPSLRHIGSAEMCTDVHQKAVTENYFESLQTGGRMVRKNDWRQQDGEK